MATNNTVSAKYKSSLYQVVENLSFKNADRDHQAEWLKKAEAVLRAPIDNAVMGGALFDEQGWPTEWDQYWDRQAVRVRWDTTVANALTKVMAADVQESIRVLIILADMLCVPGGFDYDA